MSKRKHKKITLLNREKPGVTFLDRSDDDDEKDSIDGLADAIEESGDVSMKVAEAVADALEDYEFDRLMAKTTRTFVRTTTGKRARKLMRRQIRMINPFDD